MNSIKTIENIFALEQLKLLILIGQIIMNCIEEEDLRIEKEIQKGMIAIEKT